MTDDEGTRIGEEAARRLAELGRCEIEPGLTDAEIDRVEARHGFEFATDHRAFLAVGLPVGGPGRERPGSWPDWRNGDPGQLRAQIGRAADLLLFDVRHGHWRQSWGPRPDTPEEAVEVAKVHVARAPAIVPVYAHRYLPAGRGFYGHPVLSLYGADCIYYGTDLADYVRREFEVPPPPRGDDWRPRATVPFWRDYL
ncbi:hypothetical protein HUO13_35010 [Saccharopolyspora erythraea]|uniref:hypothetical protein n=1 Tax=Saccharopolyspora erythraea TaxID=1836 RepID=UPI001BAB0C6E|nr:hypothetical protein [Saccharopolyspora erythraea]QUH05298.1 hypothetical protein HUO13_35010 [Saccharopolyspora erythraea]